MFKHVKEASGPAVFARGMLRYKQGRFEDAKALILKAGRCTVELKSDPLYDAALLLVESNLGADTESHRFRSALKSLKDSPYQDTIDCSVILADLRKKIDGCR